MHRLPGLMPHAARLRGTVLAQDELAFETYRLRVECPEIARTITPGQFFMVRPAGGSDPLLGRPFALYDTVPGLTGTRSAVELVYHTIGKLTSLMPRWAEGTEVELWGPLGNGFPVPRAKRLCCVGGGIGYTPFLAVAREAVGDATYGEPPRHLTHVEAVELIYGTRTHSLLADLADFNTISRFRASIATDDGTAGHRGFVTDLLAERLEGSDAPNLVYCCGPGPMMRAVAELCRRHDVPCWLSLESPMACGFGACFSCVTKIRTDDGWDYRRTCVEGPVFRSEDLVLDDMMC